MAEERLSRPTLFMLIARLIGQRGTCPRASVGAIAVYEGRIIASGYVGAPVGQPHCIDVGCEMENGHCVRTVHAEANVIAWAARTGSSLEGTILYSTVAPCYTCAKLLVNAGIEEVYYADEYSDTRGIELLQNLEVYVERYNTDDLESTS